MVLGSLNSFLNLYELRCRLSLDIADLYAKGFAFTGPWARPQITRLGW